MSDDRNPQPPEHGTGAVPALVIIEAPAAPTEPWPMRDGCGTVSVKRAQAEWLRASYRGWAW